MTIYEIFAAQFKEELNRLEKGKKTEQWALEAINELGEIMNKMEKEINDFKIRDMNDSVIKENTIAVVYDKQSNNFENLSLYLMQASTGQIGICCIESQNKLIPCFAFGEEKEHMSHWNDIPTRLERDGKGDCFLVKFKKEEITREHVVLNS